MSEESTANAEPKELLSREFIQVELRGTTAVINLRRPPMNALNIAMQNEIAEAATLVSGHAGIDAVVLYGGEKVFAAGADVKEMANMTYTDMAHAAHKLQAAFESVAKISQPTIAAITGFALGGGLALAMCADFRVAPVTMPSACPCASIRAAKTWRSRAAIRWTSCASKPLRCRRSYRNVL